MHERLGFFQRARIRRALFEAAKGIFVLSLGFCVLFFADTQLQEFSEKLIHFLHLNPDHRFPKFILHMTQIVSETSALVVVSAVLVYFILRMAEAYGLWRDRAWAEWLAIISGSLYLPFEFYEIYQGYSWLKIGVTLANLLLVLYLLWVRFEKQQTLKIVS